MAHLGRGTMFGMTCLGDPQSFLHAQRRPFSGSIKDVPREIYLKLFLEKGRFHKNEDAVRRAIIPQIFTDAVERQLNQTEIDLMLRYFHFKPGNITYEEFEGAIDDMKADRALSPPPVMTKVAKTLKGPPRKKTLHSEILDMKCKHRRDPLGPTDVSTRPMTTNMEYGWETMLYPGESAIPNCHRDSYFPKGGTDVTQAREVQARNQTLIGERGGYHGRSSLSRPGTANAKSAFVDIHRTSRPPTAPLQRTGTSQYLNHVQSNHTRY